MEAFVKVPPDLCPLSLAYQAVDDPSYWDTTMPAILFFYKMSVADYWSLTVYQHRLLWEWLVNSGMVKDADQP